MADKTRADIALVQRGLVKSRAKAQSLIKAGLVMLDGEVVKKSNQSVKEDTVLSLSGAEHPWVSRGGMKLAGAFAHFDVRAKGKVVLDIGASTGGFSDVCLQDGALKVYAVDVGAGQLAVKLARDHRVVSMEKTNARRLDQTMIAEPVDLLVCDASFISLKLVLPAGLDLVRAGGAAIVLIKPQFEVGKGNVGKGGVVKDPTLHDQVTTDISQWFDSLAGWRVVALTPSPIAGPDGNKEFLLYAERDND